MSFRLLVLSIALVSLSACSMTSKRNPSQEDMKVVLKDAKGNAVKEGSGSPTATGGKASTPIKPEGGEQEAAEMKEAVAAAAQHIQDTHPTTSTATSAPTHERMTGPVPAMKSLGWLKNGNTRFVKGRLRADGISSRDRLRLLAGQKPHAVIFASSDSRIPPEVIFDQKLGEVFVVRTLGLSLGGNVISSIEYAVQDLGANLVVVIGHSQRADDGSWTAIDKVASALEERSALLRDAVGTGDVKIQRALYNLESGKVDWQ
ncbi:Carbonic anhydrase 2 [compost metagenome]